MTRQYAPDELDRVGFDLAHCEVHLRAEIRWDSSAVEKSTRAGCIPITTIRRMTFPQGDVTVIGWTVTALCSHPSSA
jgi:hypothetical protein